jgi:hypothetical protein
MTEKGDGRRVSFDSPLSSARPESPSTCGTRGSFVDSDHNIGVKHGDQSFKVTTTQGTERRQRLVSAPLGWFWELQRPEHAVVPGSLIVYLLPSRAQWSRRFRRQKKRRTCRAEQTPAAQLDLADQEPGGIGL